MLLRSRFTKLGLQLPKFSFTASQKPVKSQKNEGEVKQKISNLTFLKYELTENPEFDKAFPHLAKYKPPLKIKRDTKEYDFIESLTYHNRVPEFNSQQEHVVENRKRYVEGYREPTGPIQWMSQEAKDKVHDEVERKMQELEATGLSRDELLYEGKAGGIALGLDPFFQFMKKNRIAREMLFKPGEVFTVERVIELVLRQDVGLDPALSRRHKNYLYKHQMDEEFIYEYERNHISDREPFDSNAFFAEHHNQINMAKEELNDPHKKFFKFPITREQARRNIPRKIDPLEVHWRNTEYLVQFLGESGLLKNRYQTRLSTQDQKKIGKVIKQARNMQLLPSVGFLKPSDKRSLRTLQEDLEDYTKKKINIETGEIYLARFDERRLKSDDPYRVEPAAEFDTEGYEGIKDLELEFMPTIPTKEEIKLAEAVSHAKRLKLEELKKRGVDVEKLQELKRSNQIEGLLEEEPTEEELAAQLAAGSEAVQEEEEVEEGLEEGETEKERAERYARRHAQAFEEFTNRARHIPPANFIKAFIGEKALHEKTFIEAATPYNLDGNGNRSKDDILQSIEQIKREIGL